MYRWYIDCYWGIRKKSLDKRIEMILYLKSDKGTVQNNKSMSINPIIFPLFVAGIR